MDIKKGVEEGLEFTPRFDANGLIPVIAQDCQTGEVLMIAYMNREALDQTIRTGHAVYYSRSRRQLWRKGQESGHIQKVEQILVDCDQDALLLKVRVSAGQCHTGHYSCFYRAVDQGDRAKLTVVSQKVFDPGKAYNRPGS
ncbi:MAG: phosphoribosyl-AMP cyclohydrolase [Sedimentisphaerales bacterium]|nr:phosphoribosyl-AMP cyclohydrolase [Sedimentisphaerales bacterium]